MKNIKVRKFFKKIINWIILILIAVIVGYAFVTFCYQTVEVVGPSMNPVLKDGQTVIVNKMDYRFHDVKRYDIVVYSKVDSDSYYDIKRIIGLPGETVQIINGRVYINDEQLKDVPFETQIINPGLAADKISLGKNEYFVLGDNVNNSEDSRFTNVGIISKSEIKGKVVSIYRPKKDKGKVK